MNFNFDEEFDRLGFKKEGTEFHLEKLELMARSLAELEGEEFYPLLVEGDNYEWKRIYTDENFKITGGSSRFRIAGIDSNYLSINFCGENVFSSPGERYVPGDWEKKLDDLYREKVLPLFK